MNKSDRLIVLFLPVGAIIMAVLMMFVNADLAKQNDEKITELREMINEHKSNLDKLEQMIEEIEPIIIENHITIPEEAIKIDVEARRTSTVQTASVQYQTFEVTAYTAGYESTGKRPDHPLYGVTASGEMVQENHTVACGRSYAFGTQFYIPYFDQTYTCTDRGGAITDRHLDVYMPELDDALKFGRRKLEVEVIK